FLFGRWAAGTLEFELPAPPAAIGLRLRLGKKLLDQVQVFDESGATASANTGRVVRVSLQGIADSVFELTLEYHLPTARQAGQAGSGWTWTFSPPRLRGPVLVRDVRWYVELPGDGVILSWDAEPAVHQKWGRRRLLPALRPAWTGANLESWFHGGMKTEDAADDFLPETTGPEGVAVARADSLTPLRLSHIPRTGWILACSLAVLAIGIAVAALRRVPLLFWLVVAALPLALGAGAVMWPQPVALALAAAPPGLIVLGVMLLVQWLLRSRYRRRVVFMPGFTRVPDVGSARSHVGSSLRRREPSTVDSPAE
ncbi:MAG: hypothetical protein ACJ8F7_08610, partial [Gemmataceae bacterium]